MNDFIEIEKTILLSKIKFTEKVIVDVGCGMGDMVKYLSDKYPTSKVCGIDPTMAPKAEEKYPKLKKETFKEGIGEKIPFEDNSVDILIFQKSFHHVSSFDRTLEECARVLKSKGNIVVVEPFTPQNSKERSEKLHFFELVLFIHDETEIQKEALQKLKDSHKLTNEKLKLLPFEKFMDFEVNYDRFKKILKNFYPKRETEILKESDVFMEKLSTKLKKKIEEIIFHSMLRVNIVEKQ